MYFDIKLILFLGSAFTVSCILAVCILLIATSSQFPVIRRSKKERGFVNPNTGTCIPFPSIDDEYEQIINLSVIIPAYNEEERLPSMLDECTQFLEDRCRALSNFKYEIIVVSDGSKDGTADVVNGYCKRFGTDKVMLLDLERNRGKGGAVRLGVQSARGAVILFADADGATKFEDLTKLESCLKKTLQYDYLAKPHAVANQKAISIGSRAHLEEEAVASRSTFRTFLMHGFHFLVWLLAVRNIRDTQCGFKLFSRDAAKVCFESLHVERWAFDVELLYIAQKLNIPISEVGVNWTEIEGSKITPIWSWIQMGVDLGLIWLRYLIGAWKIAALKKK